MKRLFSLIAVLLLVGCSGFKTPNVHVWSFMKDHGLEGGKIKINKDTGDIEIEMSGYHSDARLELLTEIVKKIPTQ